MLRLLELRIDNVVYRSGFARTRMQARQFEEIIDIQKIIEFYSK